MLSNGAVLLKFDAVSPSNESGEWRHIEKCGFKVTTKGCLIPYSTFFSRNKSSKKSVVRASRKFFFGDTIGKEDRASKFNNLGWPSSLQYSHLCHDATCGSPLCVIIEPQWRNLKRNYCGYDGACDCSNPIKCTSTYKPSNVDRVYDFIKYDTPDCSKKIKELFGKWKVSILPKDHFRVQDLKRKNRAERKSREVKQSKSKKKKNNTLDSFLKRNTTSENPLPSTKKTKK